MTEPTEGVSRSCCLCSGAGPDLSVREVRRVCGHALEYYACPNCLPLMEMITDPNSPIYK